MHLPIKTSLLILPAYLLFFMVCSGMFWGPSAAYGAEKWTGQATLYLWGAGMGGKIKPSTGAPKVSLDRSFSEILEDLDHALFVSGLARRHRLVLLGDFSYASLSRKGSVPPGIEAKGRLSQKSLTMAGGYRAVDGQKIKLDVLAGVRQWWIRGSVKVPLAGVDRSRELSFCDPVAAFRANFSLSPRWSTLFYGDTGGFGVGSRSTSQLVVTLNYKASENIYFSTGYRHLNVDYRSKGSRVDVTLAGPLFGITWHF